MTEVARPLQLLCVPETIALQWPDQSPRPLSFDWRGRHVEVAHARGPERIETGWWKESYIRRDYYVIESSNGEIFWIFRRLENGRWLLHGLFN